MKNNLCRVMSSVVDPRTGVLTARNGVISFRNGYWAEGSKQRLGPCRTGFQIQGLRHFSGRPASWKLFGEASCLLDSAMYLTITRESPVLKFNMYVVQYWIQHRLFAGCGST